MDSHDPQALQEKPRPSQFSKVKVFPNRTMRGARNIGRRLMTPTLKLVRSVYDSFTNTTRRNESDNYREPGSSSMLSEKQPAPEVLDVTEHNRKSKEEPITTEKKPCSSSIPISETLQQAAADKAFEAMKESMIKTPHQPRKPVSTKRSYEDDNNAAKGTKKRPRKRLRRDPDGRWVRGPESDAMEK